MSAIGVTTIAHTSLVVTDLDRSIAFYRDVLGLKAGPVAVVEGPELAEHVGLPGARIRRLTMSGDNHQIDLVQFLAPAGRAAPRPPNDVGIAHLAFRVRGIERVCRDLAARGVRLVSEPQSYGRAKSCYFLDPDGIILELLDPGDPEPAPRA